MDNTIALQALHIIQGMGRSWIYDEKRPTGLCVGALTLAAKDHGIKKSQKEVQQVVQACNNDITQKERISQNNDKENREKNQQDETQVEDFNKKEEKNEESNELNDIDDEEVDAMLNDPSEIDCKAERWTEENADYLLKMATKVESISKKTTRVIFLIKCSIIHID